MIFGFVMIIFSFNIFDEAEGQYSESETYGADFYTGFQNATADASNNVRILISVEKKIGGYLTLSMGLFSVAFFGMALVKDDDNKMPVPVIAGSAQNFASDANISKAKPQPQVKYDAETIEQIELYQRMLADNLITVDEYEMKIKQLMDSARQKF